MVSAWDKAAKKAKEESAELATKVSSLS